MDLATKSKNTNVFIKAVCILLSVGFMTGAFHFGYQLIDTVEYYDITPEVLMQESLAGETLADTNYLAGFFMDDIRAIQDNLITTDTKAIRQFIETNRTLLVKKFLNSFKKVKEEYQEDDDGYYDEENGYYHSNSSVFCDYETLDYRDHTLRFSLEEDDEEENAIRYSDNLETAEKKINQVIDSYLNRTNFSSVFSDLPDLYFRKDLRYFVKENATGLQLTNMETNVSAKEALDHTYAFCFSGGKLETSEAFNGLFAPYINENTEPFSNSKEYEIYCYLDESVSVTAYGNHTYLSYINGALAAQKRHPKQQLLGMAAFALLGLALAVYVFIVCGKRRADGSLKLAWMDYIATDVHLVLAGLSVSGLVFAIVSLISEAMPYESYATNRLIYFGILVLVAGVWALFLEFMTSFIRVCKSEKRLYKNTLFYYILMKPARFVIKKVKAFFAYQPENVKKTIVRGLGAYVAVNVLLLLLCLIAGASDLPVLVVFPVFAIFLINIVLIIYTILYFIQLDIIITAAKNRTVPRIVYQKLPRSLQILVNSLQYTRQELNAAVNKAVRDERMRTELITNVSHDLKTPLTSIINYVDLLKSCDIQDESAREYIEVLDEKGARLKRLIEDLIEASKITSGVIQLTPVNLSLTELAAQAVYERQQEFSENGLELVFKGEKSHVGAYADGNKTFRVLENLLSNAKKYSAKGSRVYCDVYETQNYSIFEIKNISAAPLDISPQELKERFVRGDKSRNNEGNGLGLSIADNICKAQGGHLNLTIDGDLFKAQVMLPKARLQSAQGGEQ